MPTATDRPHALLLTGTPGVGKTTVIRRVAERLTGEVLGGFYTEEIRTSGIREGFRLVTFEGQERVIAHTAFPKTLHVSKYGMDVPALDDVVGQALAPGREATLYLVDEIGKMECMSPKFVTAMRRLLDSRRPLVATVGLRGGGFLAEVKRRADCELWTITRTNRDALPQQVLDWLEERRHD
jgi:nucleoside-triphosphatase